MRASVERRATSLLIEQALLLAEDTNPLFNGQAIGILRQRTQVGAQGVRCFTRTSELLKRARHVEEERRLRGEHERLAEELVGALVLLALKGRAPFLEGLARFGGAGRAHFARTEDDDEEDRPAHRVFIFAAGGVRRQANGGLC